MKSNEDEFYTLFPNHKHETYFVDVGKTKIWEKKQKHLTGVVFDRNLKFGKLSCHNAKMQIKSSVG